MAFGLEGLASAIYNRYPGQRKEQKAAYDQYWYQRQFARHGIKWKAQDAREAGLHPLAALGASTMSYTPQQVGSTGAQGRAVGRAAGGAAEGLKKIIQHATGAQGYDSDKPMGKLLALEMEGLRLDNDAKRLRNINLAQTDADKASPTTGNQGLSNLIDIEKQKITTHLPRNVGIKPGALSLEQVFVDRFGRVDFKLTEEASEPVESESAVKKGITNIYDAAMLAEVARNKDLQRQYALDATQALRNAGKLKKNHIVTWIPKYQIFKMVPISGTKIKFGKPKRIKTGPNRNRKFLEQY